MEKKNKQTNKQKNPKNISLFLSTKGFLLPLQSV